MLQQDSQLLLKPYLLQFYYDLQVQVVHNLIPFFICIMSLLFSGVFPFFVFVWLQSRFIEPWDTHIFNLKCCNFSLNSVWTGSQSQPSQRPHQQQRQAAVFRKQTLKPTVHYPPSTEHTEKNLQLAAKKSRTASRWRAIYFSHKLVETKPKLKIKVCQNIVHTPSSGQNQFMQFKKSW